MKKYNLSNIMKNAWGIRRKTGCSMSMALRQAWTTEKSHETEIEIFNLVKKSNAKIISGKLMVSRSTSADVMAEIKERKHSVISHLSGKCFSMQASLFDAPVTWVVLKASANPYVFCTPVEVFRGTASEVDDWMAAHENEKCYLDEKNRMYAGKYVTAHCA